MKMLRPRNSGKHSWERNVYSSKERILFEKLIRGKSRYYMTPPPTGGMKFFREWMMAYLSVHSSLGRLGGVLGIKLRALILRQALYHLS